MKEELQITANKHYVDDDGKTFLFTKRKGLDYVGYYSNGTRGFWMKAEFKKLATREEINEFNKEKV